MAFEDVHIVAFEDPGIGQWVAVCLEYGVTTQGDSAEHAFAMAQEAVELFLAEAGASERAERQDVRGEILSRTLRVHAPALLNT